MEQKCPVCEGRTTVEAGFYGDGSLPDRWNTGTARAPARQTCRRCNGCGTITVAPWWAKRRK